MSVRSDRRGAHAVLGAHLKRRQRLTPARLANSSTGKRSAADSPRPGAPAAFFTSEIGINETDTGGVTVYVGDDGSGNSTSQVPIAGRAPSLLC